MWKGLIYVNHCTMEGLTTSGNIQGLPADALIAILSSKSIWTVMKWVNDLILFHKPTHLTQGLSGDTKYHYAHDITTIKDITDPL